jgi:DNA-binding SARP family transcriptional activator
MAALEIAASPANARKSLDRVESAYKLEPVDQVLVRFFRSRANLKMGDETKALEELRSALEIAGAMNLEQALAAEFLADRELQDFARDRVKQMATWALIEARISTMKALSEFHGREADTPPSKERELSLTALGQAKIRLRGEEIEELKPQVEELLFLLVDQGGADRDFLTEEFWPDHPPGRRTANLHMAVYGLRNAFGRDFIQLDGVAYSITEDMDIEYDVREFEHAANIAQSLPIGDPRRLFALTESIGLYGGPYLLEFESEWVIQRRRVLEMLYLDLIAQHADEALMRDQPERAIRLLQDALAIDPYRDDLNLRYILLLGRLNRRSALVAHYQRYVSLLSSDLGLDPSKEVMDAYSRMIG